jgi:hypothetical protein
VHDLDAPDDNITKVEPSASEEMKEASWIDEILILTHLQELNSEFVPLSQDTERTGCMKYTSVSSN